MRRFTVLLVSALFWLSPACGSDEPAAKLCTPGKSEACVGAGGCAGGQVCEPSGTSFGACVCGSGNDSGVDTSSPTDSMTPPADSAAETADAGPCSVANQTGCASTEKCTYVAAKPTCVPNGTVALGGACTTTTTGGDNCVGGALCFSGTCAKACDIAVTTSCPTNYVCQAYQLEGDVSAHACTPTCDPVTQVRLSDGAAACGSTNPSMPNRGCYGSPNGAFTCAPSSSTKKHGEPATTSSSGSAFLNGCAPGFAPLLNKSTGDTTPTCIAFCRPGETHKTSVANAGGISPNTCGARGATGAECRFWSYLEDDTKPKTWASDNVGFCMNYANYTYDHDMSPSTANVTFPSCTTLANTDTNGDGTADHLVFGCGPRP